MIKIIGIGGFARSGKDTACEFIKDELRELAIPSFRYALADPIKKQVNEIFLWDRRHGYGELKEVYFELMMDHRVVKDVIDKSFGDRVEDVDDLFHKFHNILYDNGCIEYTMPFTGLTKVKVSPRKMYQLWGTEFARENISDSIWFDVAEEELQSNKGSVMIIPDVRFVNEAEWIKSNPNAILVGVDRPDNSDSIGVTHASEKDIPIVLEMSDLHVENSSTLEDFKGDVVSGVKALMGV